MPRLSLVCITLTLIGCSSSQTPGGALTEFPDASRAQDACLPVNDIPSTELVPDVGAPEDFCSGEVARAQINGNPLESISVTTDMPTMSCCGAVSAHFHLPDAKGYDLVVILTVVGGDVPVGVHDLAALPEDIKVHVGPVVPDGPGQDFDGVLTGTITVESHGDDLCGLSLCIQGTGGSPEGHPALKDLQLYSPEVGVMVPFGPEADAFAITLLADPTVTATKAEKLPLGDLELADKPLLDLSSVVYYELATHRVALSGWFNGSHLKGALPDFGVFGLPFVVQSYGKRLYLGAFWTLLSSVAYGHPVVMVESIEKTGFVIEAGYPGATDVDPREDAGFLDALRKLGKLVE